MNLRNPGFVALALVAFHTGCSSNGSGEDEPTSAESASHGSRGETSGGGASAGHGEGSTGSSVGCPDGTGGNGGSPTTGTPPDLQPGVWMNITPKGVDLDDTFGANSIDLDPSNPLTLYASMDESGLWKSLDGGATWKKLGDPAGIGTDETEYLDGPLRVAVDPCDANHLYATQGVRGETLGFWVSKDGGATWARPAGWIEIAATTTNDVTTLAVDPADFAHILVGSHSPWEGADGAGIHESKDGGETWTTHGPPGGFQAGSVGIGFVTSEIWVVNGDVAGTWRTPDGGASWSKVSELSGSHGGSELYRAKNGALYLCGFQYPYRSTDEGKTWSSVSEGLAYSYYLSVGGDGKNLYTAPSFPSLGQMANSPYYTSPEDDGTTWTTFGGGAQTFDNGPYRMRFDKTRGILYSANWGAGVWALKPE